MISSSQMLVVGRVLSKTSRPVALMSSLPHDCAAAPLEEGTVHYAVPTRPDAFLGVRRNRPKFLQACRDGGRTTPPPVSDWNFISSIGALVPFEYPHGCLPHTTSPIGTASSPLGQTSILSPAGNRCRGKGSAREGRSWNRCRRAGVELGADARP